MENTENAFLSGIVSIDALGELRASSSVIASGMEQNHASIIKLVRRYSVDLEHFGGVRFEIQPFMTKGGTQEREVAMLNEQQATLLISLMRNNHRVVQFKICLVKEFFRMREAINAREQGLWRQLQNLIAREVNSQVRASFGSNLMLTRKREKPKLLTEREQLEAAIQPSLLN